MKTPVYVTNQKAWNAAVREVKELLGEEYIEPKPLVRDRGPKFAVNVEEYRHFIGPITTFYDAPRDVYCVEVNGRKFDVAPEELYDRSKLWRRIGTESTGPK